MDEEELAPFQIGPHPVRLDPDEVFPRDCDHCGSSFDETSGVIIYDDSKTLGYRVTNTCLDCHAHLNGTSPRVSVATPSTRTGENA